MHIYIRNSIGWTNEKCNIGKIFSVWWQQCANRKTIGLIMLLLWPGKELRHSLCFKKGGGQASR